MWVPNAKNVITVTALIAENLISKSRCLLSSQLNVWGISTIKPSLPGQVYSRNPQPVNTLQRQDLSQETANGHFLNTNRLLFKSRLFVSRCRLFQQLCYLRWPFPRCGSVEAAVCVSTWFISVRRDKSAPSLCCLIPSSGNGWGISTDPQRCRLIAAVGALAWQLLPARETRNHCGSCLFHQLCPLW